MSEKKDPPQQAQNPQTDNAAHSESPVPASDARPATSPIGRQDAPLSHGAAHPPAAPSDHATADHSLTTQQNVQYVPPVADGTAHLRQPEIGAESEPPAESQGELQTELPAEPQGELQTEPQVEQQTGSADEPQAALQVVLPNDNDNDNESSSGEDSLPAEETVAEASPNTDADAAVTQPDAVAEAPPTSTTTPTPPKSGKTSISKKLRLPNARQNQPYEVALDEVVRQEWVNLELVDDAGTTLAVTADGHGLSGTPVNNGECQLYVCAQCTDGTPVALRLELLINPDPKTLWDTIEPQSPLFRKPHQAYQQLADTRVRLTAARVRGRSHAHKGSFCEDDFAVLLDGKRVGYLGMVADGAGSSRFSRLASQVLCDSVPRHLEHEVRTLQSNGELAKLHAALSGTDNQRQAGLDAAGTVLANAVKRGLSDIMAHTGLALRDERSKQYHPLTMKDLYTTCLVFWALPLHGGDWLLVSYWVGDGGLAVQHGAGFTLLGTPDGGEFSGQTRFLSGEEISDAALKKRLRAAIYPDLRSVWALTDGITDAKFASEQQLERSDAWQTLTDDIIPALDGAEALYDWLGFWSQGNHDDRSVCVLQVREASA